MMREAVTLRKPCKIKGYRTPQYLWSDEVQTYDDDLFLTLKATKLLNRFIFTNKVIPSIDLPIIYSPDRRRYEILKEPIWTPDGRLKVSFAPAGYITLERNPTSGVDGYILVSGVSVKVETFTSVMSTVDIRTRDNEVYVELSVDGTGWTPKILLRGDLNEVMSTDFSCKAVRFTNVVTDGTKNAKYQLVGMK